MPVLAAFLEQRGEWLQEIAVETILSFGATRAVAEAMGETGARVAGLGAEEMVEGVARGIASETLAVDSEALAEAGVALAAQGMVETAAAEAAAEAARELSADAAEEKPEE
jgi:hypothetical protein